MNQNSLSWGIGLTAIWCIAVSFLIWLGGYSLPTELNTLGDFLAGACAPIAFFWLILGYIQQGKQLEQNTKALEQQEYALILQIDEMKESVKQQTYLVETQGEQYELLVKSVEPLLVIQNCKYDYFGYEGTEHEGKSSIRVIFDLINLGGVANEFYIRNSRNQACCHLEQIGIKERKLIEIDFDELDLEIDSLSQRFTGELIFDFKNVYGINIVLNYEVFIQMESEFLEQEEICHMYRSG